MNSQMKSHRKTTIPVKRRGQGNTDEKPPHPTKQTTTTSPTTTTTANACGNTNTNVNSVQAPASTTMGCRGALLVIGTYHSVMAGLVFRRDRLALLFSIKHHDGCINTTAVGDKYIASAGTDERVFLFTNKNSQSHLTPSERAKLRAVVAAAEVGGGSSHPGSGVCMRVRPADLGSIAPPSEVSCLLFTTNDQHLLCGCTDGQLIAYRTRDWSVTLAIPLHEKSVNAIAVHPGSSNNKNKRNNNQNSSSSSSGGGVLAVTVGSDRHVAVVDLTRGRLLSKWRYNTHTTVDHKMSERTRTEATHNAEHLNNNNNKDNNADKDTMGEQEERGAKRMRLEVRDEPLSVQFSPSGCYFAILASHSFAVYETATTHLLASYQEAALQQELQPQKQLHTFAFVNDEIIAFGDESGQLLFVHGPWKTAHTQPQQCTPQPAVIHIPSPSVTTTNNNNNNDTTRAASQPGGGPRRPERHPTRHSTRVKGLRCVDYTLFSIDAAGAVIAWRVEAEMTTPLRLTYICSANCQGRITTMSVMPL